MVRSTFYYQQTRLGISDKYEKVKALIRQVFEQHKGRYGYRRITAVINKMGYLLNHKTVRRLMQYLELKCCIRAKKYHAYRGSVGRAAPNILARHFKASQPNEKWVTDVTEFKIAGRKLFLSPILDLYNGEIISYQLAQRPQFMMVKTMLSKALKCLSKKDRPILHSDQGWQYRMDKYRMILSQHNITQSMSRKGNCLDNAVIENFFGILKSEFFYRERFTSVVQFVRELKKYIHYYNHDRIKMKLGGLSPVEFRVRASV